MPLPQHITFLADRLVDGLVYQILQISTAPRLGFHCDLVEQSLVQLIVLALIIQYFLKNASPLMCVGQRNVDLDVKPACTLDGIVHQIQSIGGSHNNYLICWREAVHLAEELIDSRSSLVGISKMVQSAAQSIDFVNKNDTSVWTSSGLREQFTHSLCSNSDEHLLELRSNYFNELASSLIGQGPSKHSLACPGRPVEQNSSSDPRAHLLILLRLLQKIDNFFKLDLDSISSIVIIKGLLIGYNFRLDIGVGYLWFLYLLHHFFDSKHCADRTNTKTNHFSGYGFLFNFVHHVLFPESYLSYRMSLSNSWIGKRPMTVLYQSDQLDLKSKQSPFLTTSST